MWHYNNEIIESARPITINGTQYPSTIFTKWAEQELNDIGIFKLTFISNSPSNNQIPADPVLDEVNHTLTESFRDMTEEERSVKEKQDVLKIKQYAHQDILNDHEDWKQRNMTANAIKVLVDLLVSQNVLTQEQVDSTELNGLKDILTTINTRRALSDQQEQDLINGVKTIEDIHNELYSE